MGGAVFNEAGTVIITNSTFNGNAAIAGAAPAASAVSTGGAYGVMARAGRRSELKPQRPSRSPTAPSPATRRPTAAAASSFSPTGANATATAIINNTIIGQDDTNESDLVVNQINGGTDGSCCGRGQRRNESDPYHNREQQQRSTSSMWYADRRSTASTALPTKTAARRRPWARLRLRQSSWQWARALISAPSTDQRRGAWAASATWTSGAFEFHRAQIITWTLTGQDRTATPISRRSCRDGHFRLAGAIHRQRATPASLQLANVWFVHITGSWCQRDYLRSAPGRQRYRRSRWTSLKTSPSAKPTLLIVITPY